MPRIDKAVRRDKKREKQRKMVVTGRGLITDTPNYEKRLEKEKRKWRNRRLPDDD